MDEKIKETMEEEVIKALSFKAVHNAKIAYIDGVACKNIRVVEVLSLVNRLKKENAELKEKAEIVDKCIEWITSRDCAYYTDICSICAHLPNSGYDGDGDVPEGVEPCNIKRAKGECACKEGILQYFLKKSE